LFNDERFTFLNKDVDATRFYQTLAKGNDLPTSIRKVLTNQTAHPDPRERTVELEKIRTDLIAAIERNKRLLNLNNLNWGSDAITLVSGTTALIIKSIGGEVGDYAIPGSIASINLLIRLTSQIVDREEPDVVVQFFKQINNG
tara:strand:+ start:352 stop:780 length:429 start_codon:yes stop_codon:yes gene_type:complete